MHCADGQPEFSVVVYAYTGLDRLPDFITGLLLQKTSRPFEVIAVCAASAAETARLADNFPAGGRVRFTFTPPEAHHLSFRKLAFTLGVKAAHTQHILLTASNVEIPSPYWLELMSHPLLEGNGIQVVIGRARFDMRQFKAPTRRYRHFLEVCDASLRLGWALRKTPYRGYWMNLAFDRNLFFAHKGYAATNHLETGDDDLFLREISTECNTEAVLSPLATVTADWGVHADRIWKGQREGYQFTKRWLPPYPFLLEGMQSCCQWIVLSCCLAGALIPLGDAGPFNFLPLCISAFILMAFEGLQALSFQRVSKRLDERPGLWTLPFFMLWRPIGNLLFRANHYHNRKTHFTWPR